MQQGAGGDGRDDGDNAAADSAMSDRTSDAPPGPNDPTRTAAPRSDSPRSDAPPSPDDPTRTRAPAASDANAATEPPARNDRLPAPLQYRDPDRYQVIGEHGRGGLGRVLRARDKELGRDVAVKELLERGNTSELRFFREALITARLEHPGIVPVHEAGRWPDGTPFYAMKLVQGRSLRELINDCKTMEDRLALIPHVIAVADAIAYAHDRKIIHRDLKPSNVIVGDFGETVVIDWGLAKDITDEIPEPTEAEAGPYRAPAADGLTVAGSVLGTPAYMAPEQREGKADERSDIYALGGIVFELATGRPPHTKSSVRTSDLSLRNVPRDLAAVVRMSMHLSPERRYREAQSFGNDLRRYLQHRPVAARRYSVVGRAILGIARNRAFAVLSVSAFAALAIAMAVSNHRIKAEEQQAAQARDVATNAKEETQVALDELTLKHAELLLSTDPSATWDVLADYRGNNSQAPKLLRARARSHGVAVERRTPHSGAIMFARGVSGGVLTLALDGSVAMTSLQGGLQKLASGVSRQNTNAYSRSGQLLAFACDPGALCLLDTQAGALLDVPHGADHGAPDVVAISPLGQRLASLSHSGRLTLWEVGARPASPRMVLDLAIGRPGYQMLFVDDDSFAILTDEGVTLTGRDGRTLALPMPGANILALDARRLLVAVGTTAGEVVLIRAADGQQVARVRVCGAAVVRMALLHSGDIVGFACKDSVAGIASLRGDSATFRFRTDGTITAMAPGGDRFLVVGDSKGVMYILDTATGLVVTRKGHVSALSAVVGPEPDFPYFVSGDESGAMRIWPVPFSFAKVLARADAPLLNVVSVGTSLVASGYEPLLHVWDGRAERKLAPHDPGDAYLSKSNDESMVAAFGAGSTVELWSIASMTRTHTLESGQGGITDVVFFPDLTIATAGRDGRLLHWNADLSHATELFSGDGPIQRLDSIPIKEAFVVVRGDSEVWLVPFHDRPRMVATAPAPISALYPSRDGRYLVLGSVDGSVQVLDTESWRSRDIYKAKGVVRFAKTSPDDRFVVIATKDGTLRLVALSKAEAPWDALRAQVRTVAFSPAGDVLAAGCADGGMWFYSLPLDQWLFLDLGADVRASTFSADGERMAVVDSEGRIIEVDVAAVVREIASKKDIP